MPTLVRQLSRRQLSAAEQLRGRDMLCFSHDWRGDPLSKTHLMRLLARDNRILWVNSIGYRAPTISTRDMRRAWSKIAAATEPLKQVLPNLFVLSPLVIPAWGKPWLQKLNRQVLAFQVRRVMRQLKFRRALNWVFNPSAAIVAGHLSEAQIIYYCVDEYAAFAGVSSESLRTLERRLLEKADAVFVSADKLLQSKSLHHPHTFLVRHGVDFDHFRQALNPNLAIPHEVAGLPRPILGYFGLMAEDWLDVPLLVKVAREFSQGSLVMLGKVTMDLGPLRSLPNVHLLGRKPYGELPAFCKAFDVGLIPFPINEVTLHSNPLKARENLAAGLPVVSTDIPEVQALKQCHIAKSHEEFLLKLKLVLDNPPSRKAQSDAMSTESWESRLNVIRSHLAEIPQFIYG